MLDSRTILDIFDDIGESLAVQQYAKEYAKEYAKQYVQEYAQKVALETTLNNAQAMLRNGLSVDLVANILHLPIETIAELAQKLASS
jgi:hypothetical protein